MRPPANVWTDEPDSTWPLKSGESGAQTSGMVQAVKAGEGTIGYADESQAQDLGVAKVKVGNTYVAPSAQGAARTTSTSRRRTRSSARAQNVFAYKVQRTPTDPSSYPVLLVSYLMGCTKYDSTDTTDLVKAYFNYIDQRRRPAGRGAERRLGSAAAGHHEGGPDRCQRDRRLIGRCSQQVESKD